MGAWSWGSGHPSSIAGPGWHRGSGLASGLRASLQAGTGALGIPLAQQDRAGTAVPRARCPRVSRSPRPAGMRGSPAAHSWVSSRVSGLPEPSLLLQLLLRLWPSLATWASGSERIRYLQGTGIWLRCWNPLELRLGYTGMLHGACRAGLVHERC